MKSLESTDMAAALAEIGCEDDRIAELCHLASVASDDVLLSRLACLRADLVRRMHESERRVDALDLLIFRIKQQSRA